MHKTTKTILVITDGIGHNSCERSNAFTTAKKPVYTKLFAEVPYSLIQTSGLSVGLPEGQMGNSEVGHMTIGSGRILYQNLVKISMALNDGSLRKNQALQELFGKTDTVHIVGLLSDGGVHSHIDHIIGLAKIAVQEGKQVWLHPITDGRDVSPTSGVEYMRTLESITNGVIKIGSVSGRFYSMDRDNRWERVERGYRVMVDAQMCTDERPSEYIKRMYEDAITDEFIEPISFDGYNGMKEGDGVIFANFRNDRMREMSKAVGSETFSEFTRSVTGLHVATMTTYDVAYPFPVLFTSDKPTQTLAEVIADAGLNQLHTAETEKYAHVTFFFNGGMEEPVRNEMRVLIPSPKVQTYDLQPQMSAPLVGDAVLKAMDEAYDFIVVNFANGDMVGHTGDFDAAVTAVETVDTQLGRILSKADEKAYNVIITSDHGNCEEMQDEAGNKLTNHTIYDVYCFVKASGVEHVKSGGLNNIAPTVLKLMGLEIPSVMDEPLI